MLDSGWAIRYAGGEGSISGIEAIKRGRWGKVY